MLFDHDRDYYAARYRYAIEKAEQTVDPGVKATHLVMAAEYKRRADPAGADPASADIDVEGTHGDDDSRCDHTSMGA